MLSEIKIISQLAILNPHMKTLTTLLMCVYLCVHKWVRTDGNTTDILNLCVSACTCVYLSNTKTFIKAITKYSSEVTFVCVCV